MDDIGDNMHYYNFYNEIEVSISGACSSDLVLDPIEYFRSKDIVPEVEGRGVIAKGGVRIRISEMLGDESFGDTVSVNHGIKIGANAVVVSGSEKWGRYKYYISRREGGVDIGYKLDMSYGFSRLRLCALFCCILFPLLVTELRNRGYAVVSGAAFRVDNRNIILLGRGGCLKTTVLMKALERQGGEYLSDDIVVVDNKGVIRPFPIFYWLFMYRFVRLEDEYMGYVDKLKSYLYGLRREYDFSNVGVSSVGGIDLYMIHKVRGGFKPKISIPKVIGVYSRLDVLSSPSIYGVASSLFSELLSAWSYVYPGAPFLGEVANSESDYGSVMLSQEFNNLYLDYGLSPVSGAIRILSQVGVVKQ